MRRTLSLAAFLCVFYPALSVAAEPPGATSVTWRETIPPQQKGMVREAVRREVARILLRPSLWRSEDVLAQQTGSQNRRWSGRHPALFGALVGAGAGAVSAATMENEWFCSRGDEDCLFYGGSRVLVGAGMGAGVGALVGWLVGLGTR